MIGVQAAVKGTKEGGIAVVAISDTLNGAQQSMDMAFAAGSLATPAGITQEDSAKYAQRLSAEDTKTAATEAKIHLKRSLEKSSELSKDNFKLVRQWLEKDENTLVLTRDFLHKIRNEMKRTFKLTLNKIKNPGSLGLIQRRTSYQRKSKILLLR